MPTIADPAFKVVPKHNPFLIIWRIEKLQVVSVPKQLYGNFYSGDSYIVAVAGDEKERNDPNFVPKENQILQTNIHFWLGNETSTDEGAVAAYKTVELDDYLGGYPVQHREVQGHESKRFLSYFKTGIKILEGGVASGLTHVESIKNPRLFEVKGKRSPVVKQCKELSWKSINSGDVYILDTGTYVFVWSGRDANNMEKIQGTVVAQQMKTEHGTDCKGVIAVDDGCEEDDLTASKRTEFEKYLPFDKKNSLMNKVDKKDAAASDAASETKRRSQLKLYKCSDDSGAIKISAIKVGPLNQENLNSQDTFIVDSGESGVWVWIGKKASKSERSEAMSYANGFVKQKGYPVHTPVTRVIDGGEPVEFKSLFSGWGEGAAGKRNFGGRAAAVSDKKFNAKSLVDNRNLAAQLQMIDDGSGEKEIFIVKDKDLNQIEPKAHGLFFSGECYIVVYKSKDVTIIYQWFGENSKPRDRDTAMKKGHELNEQKHGDKAVEMRVVQGKEPPSFTAMFGGKMIVFKGAFRQGADENVNHLLQIRGVNQYVTRAIEVDCKAGSLNSNDVFVVRSPKAIYVWAGKDSSEEERSMANQIASISRKNTVNVEEGKEDMDFWNALGGKGTYSSGESLYTPISYFEPRLFQCSNAKGKFTVQEILDYSQEDLIEDDVMLLDAGDALFLWIGNESNQEERRMAAKSTEEYIRSDPKKRDRNTPMATVKQGYEPPTFTGFFEVWNKNLWKTKKSYADIKKELK